LEAKTDNISSLPFLLQRALMYAVQNLCGKNFADEKNMTQEQDDFLLEKIRVNLPRNSPGLGGSRK
jgi:hypothetical protein